MFSVCSALACKEDKMNHSHPAQKKAPVLVSIFLVFISLGCLCLPGGVTPTETPVPPGEPVATDTPLVEQPPHVQPAGQLSDDRYLLMETDLGLWASNSDGSGLTQLTTHDYWDYDLEQVLQPGGHSVAYITPPGNDLHHMSLNLLLLPEGTTLWITDLTSPETEAYVEAENWEPLRAIRDQTSYAWSPDGTRLAFVGLMDGPSAEIYIYDDRIGEITRVSNDDYQNYAPSWSPDGETLLYMGTEGFGTGAGFDTVGVWSARGDGTNVTWLYTPQGGSEEVVGWLDDTTAVMSTWAQPYGIGNLRLFDVLTTQKTVLHAGSFLDAGVIPSVMVLFATDDGLYMAAADDPTPTLVSSKAVSRIEVGNGVQIFFAVYHGDGSLATYGLSEMDYQVSPIATLSGRLEVATYGLIWGWTSEDQAQPGAWITGPGVDIGQIYDGPARLPIWDLHNNLIFFSRLQGGGYDIYRTTFENWYHDLTLVNSLPGDLRLVAWLGQ
jgi:hypothetical protein